MHSVNRNTPMSKRRKTSKDNQDDIIQFPDIPCESNTLEENTIPNIQLPQNVDEKHGSSFSTITIKKNTKTLLAAITSQQKKETKEEMNKKKAVTTQNPTSPTTSKKGATKDIEKTAKKKRTKTKRHTVEKGNTYRNFIHRIFMDVMEANGIRSTISTSAINSLDNIASSLITKIATQAHAFVKNNKKKTVGVEDVRRSLKVLLKQPLTKTALDAGDGALVRYKAANDAIKLNKEK